MIKHTTPISEYPVPSSENIERQVLADIITAPESIMDAERLINDSMFSDELCKSAWNTIRAMAKEGQVIDLPTAYNKINRDLMQRGILPLLSNAGGTTTSLQHFASLKELYVKRRCYFAAVELLSDSSNVSISAQEMIGKAEGLTENLKKSIDTDKSTQHISEVINELGQNLEEMQNIRASGKMLRVPTGFSFLDFFTYGGFNAGNLVVLAARPSVGKTAVMLQMARAAAVAGKSANLFNLEMTNTELVQRFLFSTGKISPIDMARGEIGWDAFELASGYFASKPIYLNESSSTTDEIISQITLNAQAGKCDIAFIDYLGLISFGNKSHTSLTQAIADCTKRLKQTAKLCKIPIVLLCQLNRDSSKDGKAPQLHNLRDSGSIEQDADIVLMLERANTMDLSATEESRDVNMWLRKNRQGRAGEVKIELEANETFTVFYEKNAPSKPAESVLDNNISMSIDDNPEFYDLPF